MTAKGSNARQLTVLREALSSEDPVRSIREAIAEDNAEQQVVVFAFACILETNSAGLAILFDRFDASEVEHIANALSAIGANDTLSALRVMQAAVAEGEASGLSRLDASEALYDRAEIKELKRKNASHVAEMERCLLEYCRTHLERLAEGGPTNKARRDEPKAPRPKRPVGVRGVGAEERMSAPQWREMVRRLVPGARFARGAGRRALDSAESTLSAIIPGDLRGLLSASNGVTAGDDVRLVWPVAEVVDVNQIYRDLGAQKIHAPFDGLLCFGEDGNGDVYAYLLEPSAPDAPAIVQWDHETDERRPFARDLEDYLERRAASADLDPNAPPSDEDTSQVVSVWVWSDGSERRFHEYIEGGGSGRVSEDGLAQSRFQADYGLTLMDALQVTEYSRFMTRPTDVRELLEGFKGGEPLVEAIAGKATGSGQDKAHGVVLLYGLRYELRVTREPAGVKFIGCFDFD